MAETYDPRFDVAVSGLAVSLARVEAAFAALEAADSAEELRALDTRCRQWLDQVRRWLSDLGLTPASAAGLGLLRRAADPLTEYLEATYTEDGA